MPHLCRYDIALEAATGKRGLVVSRSTFPTSGTSSGHWLGDNYSSWAQLRVSIIGLLEFNMFGIPYIGADICGFFLDSTADLCQRWMQLGAFYTYSRNHNSLDQIVRVRTHPFGVIAAIGNADDASGQLFWDDGESIGTIEAGKLYLAQFNVKQEVASGTLMMTLVTNDITDEMTNRTMSDIRVLGVPYEPTTVDVAGESHDQFTYNKLSQGETSVDVYFPDDRWYDYYTGQQVARVGVVRVSAPRDHIPLFVRGGNVLPTQRPDKSTVFRKHRDFVFMIDLGYQVAPAYDHDYYIY
ncbi:PREDICTED: sucrase-isomaltase, intestinal-like [Priapulus caudatus]|uniref:Sucrase-isomaltase, intestinal-like n=1 Tax=Priapulus caudatus TaxID=37621 RepID=A0ABM1DYI0_PRICU|nr:PREDICTED: sucrase-isomaltase, intestinal-like [Priapulus caudatus]